VEALEIKPTKDKFIITMTRSSVDAKFLADFVKSLKNENKRLKQGLRKQGPKK